MENFLKTVNWCACAGEQHLNILYYKSYNILNTNTFEWLPKTYHYSGMEQIVVYGLSFNIYAFIDVVTVKY